MRVFIATSSFGLFSNRPKRLLYESNCEVIENPHARKLKSQELIDLAKDADVIIAGTEIYDSKVLSKLPKLKLISRVGVGVDNLDMVEISKRNIKVTKSNSSPSIAVAEFALTLILNLLKRLNSNSLNAKQGIWKKQSGFLLSDKVIGVVGTGQIGKKLISLLEPFSHNFLVYDKFEDEVLKNRTDVKYVGLEELFQGSNIVSIHLPGNEDTEDLIDKKLLSQLQDNSILINTSRGTVINETDLYDVLKENSSLNAALDVFKEEPYNGPLAKLDNVIITPHIAAYAEETRIEMELEAVSNVKNFKIDYE